MKVRHFSYDLHNGGAFIACDRLDRALRAEGADSAVFTAETIGSLLPAKNPRLEPIVDCAKSSLYANAVGDRTYVSNTLYSLCVDGAATFGAEGLGDPDILHFHWVTFLLNPISIASLAHLRLPLVWTLHDANPFTGGRHYPAGCDAFADGCPSCPQITKSEVGWPEFAVQAKTKALESFSKVVVTAPSNWLLRTARRSRVFAGCDFRVMKNCIPHHFHGRSRDEARAKVGLDPDDIAILFAAVDLAEKRKGFSLAIEAFRTCRIGARAVWTAEPRISASPARSGPGLRPSQEPARSDRSFRARLLLPDKRRGHCRRLPSNRFRAAAVT